jgi:diaminohydroxyphosphoribosylaminopyrimidine deaminase / 5-amino-6-(5-phosphoribosylamino)uracil reductase
MADPMNDERFMRAALVEAAKAVGRTSPNPAVGAVLVSKNRIIARGHHRAAGKPHAEIECLRRHQSSLPTDATLFVTLEPCSTTARTGPCTQAIINSGIKNIVIGSVDVNPLHHGRGISLLQGAGLNVRAGVLADECRRLNEQFNKWIVTGLPFVLAKCGMSVDGRLTRGDGDSKWITSAAARRHSRNLRAQVDAIVVGAETIRKDNPRLTVRGAAGARQPLRVILSRTGKLPRDAIIFRDQFKDLTVVYRNQSLRSVLKKLGKRQIISVLIEGGGQVLGEALDDELIDKIQVYVAPLFTGGAVVAFGGTGVANTTDAARVERISFQQIGSNICVTGYPSYQKR